MDNKKIIYNCQTCKYSTTHKGTYNKHLLSAKHIAAQTEKDNCGTTFSCDICKYKTLRKDTYHRHLMSGNHMLSLATLEA